MYSLLLISLFSFAQQDVQISKTEKYYFAVMSWESQPYDPLKTHTFATVIHMKDGKAEQTTLSWFPATEVVRPVQILPEKGTNLSLEKSLEFATQNKLRVSLWGPFEVSEKFYDSFKLHVGKFDRGEVAYRPCSGISVNKDSVFDCAHAVENFYRKDQSFIGPMGFGDEVSARIATELSGEYLDGKKPHPEVLEKLGLDKYPFTKKDLILPTAVGEDIKKPRP
ncbi:hypothetical protein KIH39_13825 [Telmatocola sphagniphila]|uniref:Uncharacterized protein n=1 Tax=Telmatocola sphagniphila TaxID=1123043 RepID=A0A8E6EVX7_9BACT|nr:hypothetical protein [Telmatocola sphagniphila]QVL29948.1 hypothetical protein KIH39_13825 [Telmatocola sphagniphila]